MTYLELLNRADKLLDANKISIGEWERMTAALRRPIIPVVKCGDCVYRDKGEYEYCPMLERNTFEVFYCAYGERKTADET
jgi:threonine dehydrogenase-like Zn-dependent dehydrogenase